MIKDASLHAQIIVATQSPALVDGFDTEDVAVMEWLDDERCTQARRLQTAELEEWLKDLPNDFPAYQDAMAQNDIYLRIKTLELAFKQDAAHIRNFIPYIQLHEFEALVFCGLDHLSIDYDGCTHEIESLKKVLADYHNNPEAIDNGRETAPSKRIITALKDKYNYNKTLSGTTVTKAVSLQKLREQCRHFDAWVTQLENIVKA